MAHRPTALAAHGMVVTPHYLASQAALSILKKGGNAVEAAITAASVISVVYPHMNSIGGDNFWLIYNAETGELRGLNASGRSGRQATIDYYHTLGFSKIPCRGYLAANTVPGAVSGWWEAYRYAQGSMKGKLPWSGLLTEAIDYAGNGFPISASQEYWSAVNTECEDRENRFLQRFSGFSGTFLKPDGSVYRSGEVMKQQDLAHTLEIIADKGSEGFYKGVVAKKIINELTAKGGILTEEDFAEHTADWVTPISVDYRDTVACNLPPNTQGMASLSVLNILNNYDLTKIPEGTADYYHLILEATKQAFADRDQWLTDPDFVDIPVADLLSKQHGEALAKRISLENAAPGVQSLDPKGDTVWLGIVDQAGNAVSLIQSIYHEFGSGIIPDGTGVLLQNRGSFFSLDPKHINCLTPCKRTFHTLNPAMLLRRNKPLLVYGTMGGEGQPQTQAAIVTRIIDYGFTVQDAIEAPRWLYGRTWGASSNDVKIEGRVTNRVIQELKRRGHSIRVAADYTDIMGHAGAIRIDEHGIMQGGADPRGDGMAIGY